ncbi:MAG: thioredoxin domain-containing protein [Candidatus Babeliales bacterium]|nr:thioredoxin domain-containing protein [Candidatus Babeliales bacterium]
MSYKIKIILLFTIIYCNATTDIITEQQMEQILKTKKIVVANFHGEKWCPDSQRYKKPFSKLEEKHFRIATFIKLDKDKLKDLFKKYNVGSVPQTIIFKFANEVFRTGSTDKFFIEDKLIDSLKNIK